MVRHAFFALLLAFTVFNAPALAVQPDEILQDKQLETRARALSAQLRCMVCQNESIDESEATLARDLRQLLRERLVAGDSDEAIKNFLVSRYGDFILLKPPLKPETILLWAAPFSLLVGGGILLLLRRRRGTEKAGGELTAAERARLDAVLGKASASEPSRGGISAALRRSPLVAADLDLARSRENRRDVDF